MLRRHRAAVLQRAGARSVGVGFSQRRFGLGNGRILLCEVGANRLRREGGEHLAAFDDIANVHPYFADAQPGQVLSADASGVCVAWKGSTATSSTTCRPARTG